MRQNLNMQCLDKLIKMTDRGIRKLLCSMSLAVVLTALVGCVTEDDFSVSDSNESKERFVGYVAFSIKTDASSTRATEGDVYPEGDETNPKKPPVFNKGTEDEYARSKDIRAHRAFFFNADGTYFCSSLLEPEERKGSHGHDGNDYGNAEDTYIALVKTTDYFPEDNKGKKVLVVLNADPEALDELDNAMLNTLLKKPSEALPKALQWISKKLENKYTYTEEDGESVFFTMSNSTFVSGTEIQTAIDVSKDKFKDSPEEALIPENLVTIYVERVAAKCSMKVRQYSSDGNRKEFDIAEIIEIGKEIVPMVKDKNGNYEQAGNLHIAEKPTDEEELKAYYDKLDRGILENPTEKEWRIKIENWGLNAIERNSFLFKNLVSKSWKWSEDKWSENKDFYDNWNAPDYHRSYWAVDYHYNDIENGEYNFNVYDKGKYTPNNTHQYPEQYRPGVGVDNSYEDYEGEKSEEKWSLKYLSYKDMIDTDRNDLTKSYRYSLENTFDYGEDVRVGYAPLRYGTHIILAAKLIIAGVNEEENTSNEDLYCAYGTFWKDSVDYMRYAFAKMKGSYSSYAINSDVEPWKEELREEDLKSAFNKDCKHTLYIKDGDETRPMESSDIEDYFHLFPAMIKNGDGKRFMELYENKTIFYMTKEDEENPENNQYEKFTRDQIKSLIYTYTEPVQHFSEGKMYYAIPINHNSDRPLSNEMKKVNGEVEKNEDGAPKYEYEYTENSKYDVGDFGVVRNHWYSINVNAIGSVGTSVDDPGQPIIPNDPGVEYNVALQVQILPWRVVTVDDIWL